MFYQNIFKRHELKYLITENQKKKIIENTKEYMKLDEYGKTIIQNLYFDTDNYRLIRHSIEKPVYKEKLRIRNYKKLEKDNELVFVEMKKKYNSIVYKRRIEMPYNKACKWLCKENKIDLDTQIEREINYVINYYNNLKPHVYIAYERESYKGINEKDFRVTFDENVLWREENLSLKEDIYGKPIIDEGYVIMEIKTYEAIPLWLTHILTEEKIYKTSFSKYGHAYEDILNNID